MSIARAFTRVLRAPSARGFARPLFSIPRQSLLTSTWKSSTLLRLPSLTAPFSTTLSKLEKEGTFDEELAAKFQSELAVEREVGPFEYPPVIKDFLDTSPFKLNDKPDHEDVELVRKFGDETIRVVFSISDINAVVEAEDEGLYEEEEPSMQPGGAQSPLAKQEGKAPVADETAEEEEYNELEDEELDESFPARINIIIEKPNQGALQIEAITQEGLVVIENVFYHKNASLATARTAEADWERKGVYTGPQFSNLDSDVQDLLERYLDERGINTSLALFVPDYIEYKEQKEYLNWLQNMENFVRA